MQELVLAGSRDDAQWEQYIREADPAAAIFERAHRIYEFQKHCKAEHGKQGGSRFAEFMAGRFGYAPSTSTSWAKIGEASPKLFSNAEKFAPDWTTVYSFTRLPDEQQVALLEAPGIIDRKAVAAAKIDKRAEKLEAITTKNAALPTMRYSVIYCDPPWRYEHVKTESRAIENQYPTMDLADICALPVDEMAAEDCVLFMWATAPKLAEAMVVIDAWGFEYRTCAVWDKQQIGMGYYFRQQHELLLVAARGNMPAPGVDARDSSVYREARGKHSAKPAYYAELIERMYPGVPRIELFNRGGRDGWDTWGNQSDAA
jgi:N6-adenosine-specific RNA methylase IME4